MTVLYFNPENEIDETWQWTTDVIVTEDGTEQRIQLMDTPLRSLAVTATQWTDAEVRAMFEVAMGFGAGFEVPFYHEQTKLTQTVAVGANTLFFDPSLTDMRDGCQAMIFNRITGDHEFVTVALMNADGCTLGTNTAKAWDKRASICPMWAGYTSDKATVTRQRPNNLASIGVTVNMTDYIDPFLNEYNDVALTMFNGLPVITKQPNGDTFTDNYNNGATVIDFGAVKQIRNLWQHTQIMKSFDFLCHRISNRNEWKGWKQLADYCRGSLNPFYMPTYRPDFELTGPIVGNTVHVKGQFYLTKMFPFAPFKAVMVTTEAGSYYATVTNAVANGNDTTLTLSAALPAGDGYAIDQQVSFLLQMRLGDDLFTMKHVGRDTTITLNMRTCDA